MKTCKRCGAKYKLEVNDDHELCDDCFDTTFPFTASGCPPGMPWWDPWCIDCDGENDICPICKEVRCRNGCPHTCVVNGVD